MQDTPKKPPRRKKDVRKYDDDCNKKRDNERILLGSKESLNRSINDKSASLEGFVDSRMDNKFAEESTSRKEMKCFKDRRVSESDEKKDPEKKDTEKEYVADGKLEKRMVLNVVMLNLSVAYIGIPLSDNK